MSEYGEVNGAVPRVVSPVELADMVWAASEAEDDFSISPLDGMFIRNDIDDPGPVDDPGTSVVLDRWSDTFEEDVKAWCESHAEMIEHGTLVHVRQLSEELSSLAMESEDPDFVSGGGKIVTRDTSWVDTMYESEVVPGDEEYTA